MTREMAINILRGAVLGTNEQTHEAVFMAIKALKEQERVDAVEVVRCKDCIHRMKNGMCEYKDYSVVAQDDNDFCSWGERREDDNK